MRFIKKNMLFIIIAVAAALLYFTPQGKNLLHKLMGHTYDETAKVWKNKKGETVK